MSRGVAPAHFERAFARELEHVPVQQEEACEPELVDQLQLLFESRARFTAELVTSRVAVLERALADVRELHDRRLGTVGEVGVPVAELLGQVEPEPVGELDRERDRGTILREAFDHLRRREQDALVVATALGLAAVERAPVADGDEDVLERRAAQIVRVHVSRDDRPDAE